ncbi:hypothetical protein LR48_Vigan02g125900 [Vigna angularis]|uniref:Uncharacterized protein n=1 Tax=Phaseolus angularis TaxID=3914 RepID=A0A0L9TY47_PHAAN|nr:hypothetical protein LR48_Vigan02g125900 [Vigna angularis]
MAETLFSWSGEDAAAAAWWRLGAGSAFLFLGFLVLFLCRWIAKWIWGFYFLVCSTASDCSLGKKREKEREHLDGVVEASPVNIAPISAGLQPQPLGEVVGGQQDLLCRILAEGAQARVGEPSRHSNCVLLLAELNPSVKYVSLALELLDLPHHLRSLPYRPLELRLHPHLGQRPYLKPIGGLRLHLRQGLLIGVENLGC